MNRRRSCSTILKSGAWSPFLSRPNTFGRNVLISAPTRPSGKQRRPLAELAARLASPLHLLAPPWLSPSGMRTTDRLCLLPDHHLPLARPQRETGAPGSVRLGVCFWIRALMRVRVRTLSPRQLPASACPHPGFPGAFEVSAHETCGRYCVRAGSRGRCDGLAGPCRRAPTPWRMRHWRRRASPRIGCWSANARGMMTVNNAVRSWR